MNKSNLIILEESIYILALRIYNINTQAIEKSMIKYMTFEFRIFPTAKIT